MNEFLAIFSNMIRIATFQWHGEVVRDGPHDRRDLPVHHRPWTGSHPVRRSRR
ncbi:hypothetical protein P9272_23475 [Mesorhizobium sp. WSM4976]|uniref:hypothetical protein n=1 Tax=Mesorhizobium sp. WSM4976 TaxID=3038549 RepID=UPI002415DA02|nr:hypothetical protein [Mesorhizobium sp. WSM4976]MDG4896530.1 hypothetical protein [Mesorhizobium sp. WSM4976]